MWVTSDENLGIHFNPAALLSVGDALTFVKELTDMPKAQPAGWHSVRPQARRR
jgi:hypothetical protein